MKTILKASPRSVKALDIAAKSWCTPVLLGQWIFVVYIFYVYGWPLLTGNIAAWNDHLSQAYVAGRVVGNISVAVHLALATVIHFLGPLQLVPMVRLEITRTCTLRNESKSRALCRSKNLIWSFDMTTNPNVYLVRNLSESERARFSPIPVEKELIRG